MKSPRSTSRIFAPVGASSRARVPPPAPLPMMTMSKEQAIGQSGHQAVNRLRRVDLIHQLLIFHRPLEAHLRLRAALDRIAEVTIHRLVSADVAKAREDDARQALG